jgi:hypothetical protein
VPRRRIFVDEERRVGGTQLVVLVTRARALCDATVLLAGAACWWLQGESEYRKRVAAVYEQSPRGWLTPAETFSPWYSRALARYLLSTKGAVEQSREWTQTRC